MKIAFEIECGLVGGMGPRVGVDINGEQVTSQILGQHTILEYSIDNQTDTEVVIHYKNILFEYIIFVMYSFLHL